MVHVHLEDMTNASQTSSHLIYNGSSASPSQQRGFYQRESQATTVASLPLILQKWYAKLCLKAVMQRLPQRC